MNNSSFTGLLQKLNDEKAVVLIPAIVFIAFLMLTGSIGNIVVCYFYGCKTKTSPTSCFIIVMAILDLLRCIISMPMEIVDLRFMYMFPDATVCKVQRAALYVFTISSGLILIAIAAERYRRICSPFRKQFTVFQARLICFISMLIAFVLSWPSLVFYTVVAVDLPIPGSGVIQVYDCTIVRDDSSKVYLNAFNGMQILLFILTVLPLTVLYTLVYRQFIRLNLFRKYVSGEFCISLNPSMFLNSDNSSPEKSNKDKDKRSSCHNNTERRISKKSQKPSEGSNVANEFQISNMTKDNLFMRVIHTKFSERNSANSDESNTFVELKQTDILAQYEEQCDSTKLCENDEDEVTDRTSENFNNDNSSREGDSIRLESGYYFEKKRARDLNNVRNTKLMLIITITFIVSFLPYLCLVVWLSISTDYAVDKMTDLQLIMYSIGIRSYFLNSALNPIIYVFVNLQLKDFFGRIICAWHGANVIQR